MLLFLVSCASAQRTEAFAIQERNESDPTGSEFALMISKLELPEREEAIYRQLSRGNIPPFLRQAVPIRFQRELRGTLYHVTLYVMPDYLSIGTNDDHLLMPMTPILAQRVADLYQGVLPTKHMVDLIWEKSGLKLTPSPIPPSPAMVTVDVFKQHAKMVAEQRQLMLYQYPWGTLTSGHKKDVILSRFIKEKPGKVIIYGWHYPEGTPIQPEYGGHAIWYADYSHGIRLIASHCMINGKAMEISDLLKDQKLFQLFSDESAPMEITSYDTLSSNYPQ